MRTFKLVRDTDPSGISGTGDVAEGVEWEDGQVVIWWRSKFHSIEMHDNIRSLENVHGHSGATRVVWNDGISKNCSYCRGTGRWTYFTSDSPQMHSSICGVCRGTGNAVI